MIGDTNDVIMAPALAQHGRKKRHQKTRHIMRQSSFLSRIGKSNGIFAPVSPGAPRRRPHRLDAAAPLCPATCACRSARWSGSGGVSRVPRGREPWNGWQAGREDGTRAGTGAQVGKRPSRRARRRQDHAGVGLVEHEYRWATAGGCNGRWDGRQLEMPQDARDHRLLGDDGNNPK